MQKGYSSLIFTILLFIIISCSTKSTPVYELTTAVEPPDAGSVNQSAMEAEEGDSIAIEAIPNDHWVFQHWSGDYTGNENPASVFMDRDKSVTALFEKQKYPLTITTVGKGEVEQKVIQAKTEEYPYGSIIELTAMADKGWEFIQWEGDIDGNENPMEITIEEPTEITAVFEIIEYPLTVQTVGEGQVDQKVIQPKTTDYPYGTVVELTATPDDGWMFTGWEGDIDGNENPIEITIEEPTEITAVFEIIEYPLTVQTVGEGQVDQKVIQPKTTDYPYGTVVELTAIPDDGWIFTGWEGDLEGSVNPQTITITEEKNVTAVFERDFYDVTVSVQGEGEVDITLVSGQERDGRYEYESVITITTTASEGWKFEQWQGDLDGNETPATITIQGETTITAVFTKKDYSLTIIVEGEGEVEKTVVQPKTTEYPFETIVELTAKPANGWLFFKWSGDINSTENPVELSIDSDKTIYAQFKRAAKVFGGSGSDYGYSVTKSNNGGYVITGSTSSNDGDFAGMNHGESDIFVLKIDSQGKQKWIRTFGGSGWESGNSIIKSNDGGYILTGSTQSTDGDFPGSTKDIVVIKLFSDGSTDWIRTYGGSEEDVGTSIVAAEDGGYVLTGYTHSNDGDFAGMNNGLRDGFVIKINESGNIQWIETIGGSSWDTANSITTAHGSGFIITGQTYSNDGDFTGRNGQVFIIKVSENGNIEWVSTPQGINTDYFDHSIAKYPFSGYVISGYTARWDDSEIYNSEVFVFQVDNSGQKEWIRDRIGSATGALSDMGDTRSQDIIATPNGDVITIGYSNANTSDFAGLNRGGRDIFIMKHNSSGTRVWLKTLGGTKDEGGFSITPAHEGGYLITGYTRSTGGDFTDTGRGASNIFILRINDDGVIVPMY